mmetsp:Transcript_14014/g.23209  ORF Transcript_14014/g.23209 Transcript_14014/m.23209 type:complete len:212 (+) Transcript_14014:145-780(+)
MHAPKISSRSRILSDPNLHDHCCTDFRFCCCKYFNYTFWSRLFLEHAHKWLPASAFNHLCLEAAHHSSDLIVSSLQRRHTSEASPLSFASPSSHQARRISLNALRPCSRSSFNSACAFVVASSSCDARACSSCSITCRRSMSLACWSSLYLARSSSLKVFIRSRQPMHTTLSSISGRVLVQYHSCNCSISTLYASMDCFKSSECNAPSPGP